MSSIGTNAGPHERRDVSCAIRRMIGVALVVYPEAVLSANHHHHGIQAGAGAGAPDLRIWSDRFDRIRRILQDEDDENNEPRNCSTIIQKAVDEVATWPQWCRERDGLDEMQVRLLNTLQRVLLHVSHTHTSPVASHEVEAPAPEVAQPNIPWDEILSIEYDCQESGGGEWSVELLREQDQEDAWQRLETEDEDDTWMHGYDS